MQKIPVTRERKGSEILLLQAEDVVKVESIRNREFVVHTPTEQYFMATSLDALEESLYEEGFRLIDQMNLVNMNHVSDYDPKKGAVSLGHGISPAQRKSASAAWIYEEHIKNVMSLLERMKKLDQGILPDEGDDELFETILAQEEDHRFARSYAMIKAIYEKKKTELMLEESELRFKSLFEHNPDPICSFNLQGLITSMNPAMRSITGYEDNELVGQVLDAFVLPEQRLPWRKHFEKTLAGEGPQKLEITLTTKGGEEVDMTVLNFPIYVNRQIAGVHMIGQDISDRKRSEEMLLRSEKLSVVGQMAAGVAHEIRNPLTSLKGFVQLLQSKVDGYDSYFNIMQEELDRINFIVSEFLVIAKPQSVRYTPKDAMSILQSTIVLLNSQAIMHNVDITTVPEGELPLINCDENQIKQVFINILNNAIDSMPDGGEIRIELLPAADKDDIIIRFIDQGTGIPEDRLNRLGEPFYTTKEKGTGLGLMVTSRIIENHGGSIRINSSLGKGTTVELCLPGMRP